jgi:hypothetical protein
MVISTLLYGFGNLQLLPLLSELQIWSLSGALAALLLGALHLMRVGRPHDRTLTLVALAGSVTWVIIALSFGVAIGNVLDPRALTHATVAFVLGLFAVRSLWVSRAAGT